MEYLWVVTLLFIDSRHFYIFAMGDKSLVHLHHTPPLSLLLVFFTLTIFDFYNIVFNSPKAYQGAYESS